MNDLICQGIMDNILDANNLILIKWSLISLVSLQALHYSYNPRLSHEILFFDTFHGWKCSALVIQCIYIA